jgi:hypothetical protein
MDRGVIIPAIVIRAMMVLGVANATGCSAARRTGIRIRDRRKQKKSRKQQKGVPYHKSNFLDSWTVRERRLFATIQKIVRMTKRFDPSVSDRAESAFN